MIPYRGKTPRQVNTEFSHFVFHYKSIINLNISDIKQNLNEDGKILYQYVFTEGVLTYSGGEWRFVSFSNNKILSRMYFENVGNCFKYENGRMYGVAARFNCSKVFIEFQIGTDAYDANIFPSDLFGDHKQYEPTANLLTWGFALSKMMFILDAINNKINLDEEAQDTLGPYCKIYGRYRITYCKDMLAVEIGCPHIMFDCKTENALTVTYQNYKKQFYNTTLKELIMILKKHKFIETIQQLSNIAYDSAAYLLDLAMADIICDLQ